jgi:hypothetical protein
MLMSSLFRVRFLLNFHLSFSIVATELHTQFSLELLTFAAIFTIRNEDESKLSNTLCAQYAGL